MRSVLSFLSLKTYLLVVALACVGSLCVACSGGAEPQAESTEQADAQSEQKPFDGQTDEEMIAAAQSCVEDMYFQVVGMKAGSLYEQAWADAIEDDYPYYPVTELSTMQELEDRWYQKFSTRYTIEEAIGGERGYREFNGALYTRNAGMGSADLSYDVQEITAKSDDEVEFAGVMTDERDSSQMAFTMSLVYEGGQWKYGVWKTGDAVAAANANGGASSDGLGSNATRVEVTEGSGSGSGADSGTGSDSGSSAGAGSSADSGAASSGSAAQQSDAASSTSSWTSQDYFDYLMVELTAKGHYESQQSAMVERDTATSMTVAIGDDTPQKWTVTGRYTLDKSTLSIYDETFLEYI